MREQHALPVAAEAALRLAARADRGVAAIANAERPDVLVGYGGWIDLFFKTVAARGIELQPPKLVMYMGEALPHGARELHRGATSASRCCRATTRSSRSRSASTASTARGFHVHEDLCHVRIVGADGRDRGARRAGPRRHQQPGQPRVGAAQLPDRRRRRVAGRRARAAARCALLSELEGRVEDILPLADGRFVHPRAVWQVFKDDRDGAPVPARRSTSRGASS